MPLPEKSYEDFVKAFKKLKSNREKVPFDELRTKYAAAYVKLENEVIGYADWFFAASVRLLVERLPLAEGDAEGARLLKDGSARICREALQGGSPYMRARSALVRRLDFDGFVNAVDEVYFKIEREIYNPYWQRHCRIVGNGSTRWVYNDIIGRFWCPPGRSSKIKTGAWIDKDYNVYLRRLPPENQEDAHG
jgi:hypothetical protein